MTHQAEHIAGITTHKRLGKISHGFRYGVDYVLIDPEEGGAGAALFSRNRFNLMAVHDCDHGGPLGQGRGPTWARDVLAARGLGARKVHLLLLTQPRFLGYVFNPVSFWLVMEDDTLIAAIAEVSTPFGDRHSYLCHSPDFGPITKDTRITTPKSLHVSPFQDVAGTYAFGFDITPAQITIRILHRNGPEGVLAVLSGPRQPMTNAGLLRAGIRRPLGALRTMTLIYWQALRLKLKGARYRAHPTPPNSEIT
ncbi:DUF1365 domain-containing protein [Pseudorhodobacter turbinis]|uniref:DUF1365 domain-containing protein n=1 Tax=Pseudorhodobacter turbinis TaxID=2500533 RepID=A0A4P8EG09_9RHOB|nr:DUF1365 domain-containing protein [Pseudorhodobacter turbinis]QCO56071.1 DUF1365 domain-containing protein [Pseudorhodobacter turbinis]